MLQELHVRDLALVDTACVRFGPGLNLLTGETGSGKSLIVDALGLSLGARASADQVRQGADRARAEALFDIGAVQAARRVLEAMGHEGGDAAVLAREVGRRGGARLNGRPAAPGQLRDVGRALVGIHGQHDHRLLMDPEAQTLLLDTFAGALPARDAVAAAHAAWSAAVARLANLERVQARGQREEEYLRWQMEELRGAGLRAGEDEELAAERAVARNAARLAELVGAAVEILRSEEGLPAASGSVRAAAELDGRLGEVAGRLEALDAELADAGAELRRYVESLDSDPARLEAIEARLAVLEQVKRKYGGSLEAALAERERLEGQVGQAADLGAAVEVAQGEVATARGELEAAGAELTSLRADAAVRLSRAVTAELAGLRLEGGLFEARLQPRAEIAADGAEEVEMRFSANPGEAPAPLARVASGGELSRVMLAIRTAGAESEQLPTLVFDEVDAGIGGEAAVQVGLRLKALGACRQVLVVTHLAQIACFADHHLVVEKAPGPGGRVVVRVRELATEDERARELARMMSGTITPKALARAHELLDEARRLPNLPASRRRLMHVPSPS
ncbi:MAG TPA: DNA repair protein RecN [Candidatus Dormibacteraeota bacterium]|nr:DNA repair protein RecN [Candidatus Dormibacteraeota bacterium]